MAWAKQPAQALAAAQSRLRKAPRSTMARTTRPEAISRRGRPLGVGRRHLPCDDLEGEPPILLGDPGDLDLDLRPDREARRWRIHTSTPTVVLVASTRVASAATVAASIHASSRGVASVGTSPLPTAAAVSSSVTTCTRAACSPTSSAMAPE